LERGTPENFESIERFIDVFNLDHVSPQHARFSRGRDLNTEDTETPKEIDVARNDDNSNPIRDPLCGLCVLCGSIPVPAPRGQVVSEEG